jgi:hypothetical protein
MCEGVGLAASGASNNEQWRWLLDAVLDGTTLLGIKRGEVWCRHEDRAESPIHQQARLFRSPQMRSRLTCFALNKPLGPHALAAAVSAAQTLDKGDDWRVGLDAATNQLAFGDAADMATAQALNLYVTRHVALLRNST